MATPILKIPVDDAAFKKFIETFNKYQKALGDQDSAWADINDALNKMTESMEKQKEAASDLTEEERDRAKALKEIADQQKRIDTEQEARDTEASKRRQKAINQVREYGRGVASAAMSLTKWFSISSAVGIGTGILGGFGLGRFSEYAGDARRQASGMGISIGQMQRTNVAMSPYFDSSSTIGRVANMAGDPTQIAPLLMMGLNPRGADPAELTLQAASRARSMFIKSKGNLAIAEAQGLTQIFSPEELRRMSNASSSEFTADQNLARKESINQGLSDKTARKWQQFTMTLDNAGYKLKNALIDKLTVFAAPGGPLENLVNAFVKMTDDVLTKTNLDAIASGLNVFAKYINSPEFQKGFQSFTTDIVALAGKIHSALVLLGWVPNPTSGQTVEQQNPTGAAGGGRDFSQEGFLGGGIHRDDGTSFKIYSNKTYQDIGKQLMSYGYSQEQAKGILTNFTAETTTLDPFAWGDKNKKGVYEAYGLGQWRKDRRDVYLKQYGHTMESVKDRQQAIAEQTWFAHYELSHSRKNAGDEIKRLRDAASVAGVFSREFEGAVGKSGDRYTESYRRARAAAGAPNITISVNNQTGHSVAVTANSAASQ